MSLTGDRDMKKYMLSTLLFVFLCMSSSYAAADDTMYTSDWGNVAHVNLLGEKWHNANRGGFYFMTDNLPTSPYSVDYFIVRGGEKYINRLLSILLSAKSMNKKVIVNYKVLHPENPQATEGDVVSIGMQ
jgi:hypothetical protein